MNIQLILTSWLICVIVLCFVRLKWAVALFLAYQILVPYINLGLPGLGTGENFIKLIMIICCITDVFLQKRKLNIKPFLPFIGFYIVSLLMIPFQDGAPTGYMIDFWRQGVMSSLFLPIVIWNIMLLDASSINLFRNTMFVAIFIAIGYGLFQTTLDGLNPYIMYLSSIMDQEKDLTAYYEAAGEGRMFGRISSVFEHPMRFGLFIGLSFVYVCYFCSNIKKIIIYPMIFLIIAIALFCGVRSVVVALVVTFVYYLFIKKNFKLLLSVLVSFIVSIFILSFMPELSDYLGSIVDINNDKGAVKGSSVDMRISQFYGAINEASQNPLFGMGYGWTYYYNDIYGNHPVCHAFESLIYVVICNSGLLGVFLWVYMVLRNFAINKKMHSKNILLLNCLTIFYILYSMITGEYLYMKLFLMFYTVMLGKSLVDNNKYSKLKVNGKKSKNNCLLPSSISSYT